MQFPTVLASGSTADFFAGAGRDSLLLRRCRECGHVRAGRRPTCRACGMADSSWEEASGRAVLRSWARHPARGATPALVFGLVELEEGPWLESLLVVDEGAALADGTPMRVVFVRGDEGDAYPAFAPVE